MKRIIFLLMSLGLIIVACSRKNAATTAVPKITYTKDVLPILQASCSPCHFPAQGGKVASFDGYDATKIHIDQMLTRVQLDSLNPKFMPFKHKKPSLTSAQIDTLKRWGSDGYLKD